MLFWIGHIWTYIKRKRIIIFSKFCCFSNYWIQNERTCNSWKCGNFYSSLNFIGIFGIWKYDKGYISKHSFKTVRNRYDLRFGEDDNEVIVRDIVSVFNNPNNSAFTRMLSLSLRHGAKPAFLVEQLQKDKESDYFSFSKCIARVLKIYIQNGEKVCSEKVCQECNQEGLIYQDGCALCPSCGHSKCG